LVNNHSELSINKTYEYYWEKWVMKVSRARDNKFIYNKLNSCLI
jgi:hypothetical protein